MLFKFYVFIEMIIKLVSSKKQKRRVVLSFSFLRALSTDKISEENQRYISAARRTLHLPNSAIKFSMRGARARAKKRDSPIDRTGEESRGSLYYAK